MSPLSSQLCSAESLLRPTLNERPRADTLRFYVPFAFCCPCALRDLPRMCFWRICSTSPSYGPGRPDALTSGERWGGGGVPVCLGMIVLRISALVDFEGCERGEALISVEKHRGRRRLFARFRYRCWCVRGRRSYDADIRHRRTFSQPHLLRSTNSRDTLGTTSSSWPCLHYHHPWKQSSGASSNQAAASHNSDHTAASYIVSEVSSVSSTLGDHGNSPELYTAVFSGEMERLM